MNEPTITQLLERIGHARALYQAGYANERIRIGNREDLLQLVKQMRDDVDTLGHLTSEAANGRGPDACSLTPLQLTTHSQQIH